MKAIILCAGLGTRLRPYTKLKPKPLFPVLGEPLLANIIRHLSQFGANHIAINLHHLGEQIKEYVEFEDWGDTKFSFYHEKEILGTGGALKNMEQFIHGEEFLIVHNGDVVSNVDLSNAISQHQNTGAVSTMVLADYSPINTVKVGDNHNILGFTPKIKSKINKNKHLTFTGISVINSKIVKYFPNEKTFPITTTYRKIIDNELHGILAYTDPQAYWMDIGTKERYLQLHEDILLKGKYELVGREYLPDKTFMGAGVEFGNNVEFRGFNSIGDNCVIEDNVALKNCVVWEGCRICEGKVLRGEILAGKID